MDLKHAIITIILISAVLGVAFGIKPRGETKTLNEVLSIAKQRYTQAAIQSVDSETATQINEIGRILSSDVTGSPSKAAADSERVAQILSALIEKAGYTSRAALTELAMQHQLFAQDPKSVKPEQLKLLYSRTYHALASELETTKFGL